MTEPAKHDDIGKNESDTPTYAELMQKMAAVFDAIVAENERAQDDNNYRAGVQRHNLKAIRQYYWFRFIFGFSAAALPWITLYMVVTKMENNAFAMLQPAAQFLLISGSFVAVIVLYALLLRGIFGLSKNPHEDILEPPATKREREDDPYPRLMGEYNQLLKDFLTKLPPQ